MIFYCYILNHLDIKSLLCFNISNKLMALDDISKANFSYIKKDKKIYIKPAYKENIRKYNKVPQTILLKDCYNDNKYKKLTCLDLSENDYKKIYKEIKRELNNNEKR